MTSLTRISPLLALAILYGCQQPRHEACNPADSAAYAPRCKNALPPTLPPKRAAKQSRMPFRWQNQTRSERQGCVKALTY